MKLSPNAVDDDDYDRQIRWHLVMFVQVRTKDQLFNSVGHLVEFHMTNGVPIVSADSELVLVTPVTRGPREM